ncbi:MAG: tetraacyldisaccharide 4'-kinase [Verrucomicrobiota bacterium]
MRARWQQFLEDAETRLLQVIFEQRPTRKEAVLQGILFALAQVFSGAVKLRRVLYNARILRDATLGVQVIAVGNLTVGGTGKTPVVEKFARALQDAGRKVAILSRGYRSKPKPLHRRFLDTLLLRDDTTPPRIVSDGQSLLLDSLSSGDEPYMLASNLRDVVVLVDKDRVKAGRYAVETFGCDTLLLDDGFQYWRLRGRRTDVVLVDAQQPFGNGFMLPRGTLREPPSHLRRANVVFLTKVDRSVPARSRSVDELRAKVAQLNPTAEIIECVHRPLYFENVFSGERHGLDLVQGRQVASLSGIAQPESFESKLVELGAEIVLARRFADHHRFDQQEILEAINRAKKRGATCLLTTQKDAVRFPKLDRRDLPIFFMRVEIQVIAGAEGFEDCVSRICFR